MNYEVISNISLENVM